MKEFDEGINLAGALGLDGFPQVLGQGLDFDLDFVEFGAGDPGADFALGNLQVADGAIANIGAAARQSVGEVAVGL